MSSSSVKEKFQVSPYFVFFLINANQVGVSILNFQTNLVRSINNDGWMDRYFDFWHERQCDDLSHVLDV